MKDGVINHFLNILILMVFNGDFMELELFKEYFEYKDGSIYWIKKSGTRSEIGCKAGFLGKNDYYRVMLKKKSYLVHRIIYGLVHGEIPEVVDHIDRNSKNNLVENLRKATPSENVHNSAGYKNVSTGVKGIRLTRYGKYEARVGFNNVMYQVGTFRTLDEAIDSVKVFREKLHGEFCCHG